MPFEIVKQDITKIKCDAIVNAANNSLLGGGGVDGAIHRAAGPKLLEECKTLGGCETGESRITGAYNLPCKYVIHTVGPVWRGGKMGEERLLRSCYKTSFEIAKFNHLESIAFPLISAGAYGYPKKEAFEIALEETKEFLKHYEMTVYIVVFDDSDFKVNIEGEEDISEYLSRDYKRKQSKQKYDYFAGMAYPSCRESRVSPSMAQPSICTRAKICEPIVRTKQCSRPVEEVEEKSRIVPPSIQDMIEKLDESFAEKLLHLIDRKHITDVECYKKANVSRQTWHKIISDKDYRPSKTTIFAFAFALELTYDEANALLATAGFTFSPSILFDVLMRNFFLQGIYDVFYINEVLFEFDQPCIGVVN